MKIDRRLHLIVPLYAEVEDSNKESPVIAYVHSTPLSEEMIDRYHRVLGPTYSQIMGGGYGIVSGPGMAMRILKSTAQDMKRWDDNQETGVLGARHLVEEIHRLTMVVVPRADGRGWEPLPLNVAIDQKKIDPDDLREVENAIAFFIVGCAVLNRDQRRPMMEAAAGVWGARLSSLNSTAFTDSLQTSTAPAPSGEKSPAPAPRPVVSANAVVDGKAQSVPH